jgi:hypothetical protein
LGTFLFSEVSDVKIVWYTEFDITRSIVGKIERKALLRVERDDTQELRNLKNLNVPIVLAKRYFYSERSLEDINVQHQ